MNEHEKEQVLHKIVAGSAFVFALSLLPIAQYYLTSSGALSKEQGAVAGVSTDSSITSDALANFSTPSPTTYASLADCQAAKTKEVNDLETYRIGKEQADVADYNTSIQPFQAALSDPATTTEDRTALLNLIETNYHQPYLSKVSAVESAVSQKKAEVESRSCPVE